jgi:STE24 endopeptidase
MTAMSEIELDLERQEKAKQYARINRRMMVVDLALGAIYALMWLFFGWSLALRDALLEITTNDWFLVLGYVAVFGGIYYLIDLPITFYDSYILPHRFELSNQTIWGWISDQLKGIVVGVLIGGLILEVIYALLRAYPETWWIWVAGFLLLFSVLLANLAPLILFPIFYKFVPLEEEYSELIERLTRLAERAGANVKGVFKFDMSRRTKAANAALTGLGNTRRIILGDTLLDEFTTDEIETVIAHELGHHVHKDIPLGIVFESVITVVGLFFASLILQWGSVYFGFDGPSDIAAFPLFLLVIGAYGLVTMPLGNAFSRWREKRADQYALEVTGKGDAYASALIRLANQNLADVDPEPWVEFLLYSHPALNKRIAMANQSESTGI